jgi:hypothetical protein
VGRREGSLVKFAAACLRGKTVLPCRPRRDAKTRRCPHGRDISCPARHGEHDPRLGRALCGDCYDYTAAVLFNAHAGKLWRRFTTYLPRHLALSARITQKALRALVRVRYVKVAEYQARGVVHFHAVIRLDATGDGYQPPPARLYMTPALGSLTVQEITEPRVRRWRKGLLDAGVGQVTVAKAYRLLTAIMNTAVDDGMIRRNPVPHQRRRARKVTRASGADHPSGLRPGRRHRAPPPDAHSARGVR